MSNPNPNYRNKRKSHKTSIIIITYYEADKFKAMKKIPTAEQSLLCSSTYINNFKRVIEELVYNSLDAASSSIAIRVCIQENYIQVLDNGNGILKDNFTLLGQKYATSKYVDIKTLKSAPNNYGYRGLSLANIIDVSQCVKITSRHENSNDTWMKTLYNGQEKEICKTVSRPSKGTTVEIKGFLYNLNIQRKLIDSQNELQNIKIALQQLSLVHFNVSISLRDDSKNDVILQIHKNRNIHELLRSIFHINEKDLKELQVEKNEYKVKAFIGKNTTESNNYYQWIYINGKVIYKSIIHKKLNEGLSKFLNTRNNITKKTHANEDDYDFDANLPFYFIFITCPNNDFDLNYNSEKSLLEFKDWKEVNNLIEKLVQFYSGSLVAKKEEMNKVGSAEKKSDTRAKIKGIIEKVLNNQNKPQKISQLQNGVKGKILKRNRKKKRNPSVQRILNKKTYINNPCHSSNYPKMCDAKPSQEKKQHPNSIKSKVLQNMQDSINKVPKPKVPKMKKTKKQTTPKLEKIFDVEDMNGPRNNDREVNSRIPKKKKIKKHVKTDNRINDKDFLMKKFESPTKTVRKRIKYLRQKVHSLLHRNDFKEYSSKKKTVYSFINNETQYHTITNNSTTLSLRKKADQNLNIYISRNNHKVKTSYDLIKAIVTSQYKMTENENTLTHYRQSYKRKTNVSYNETFIPLGTYNSHINNVEAIKRMGYFTSETSRNNLFLHDQELFPVSSENIFYNKSSKLLKDEHKRSKKISNFNCLNRYCNQEPQGYSYTIEMTDRHEIISNRNETYYSMDKNLPQGDSQTQSLYFRNTYTLEKFTRSSHQNDTNAMNKTYSLIMQNTSSSYYSLEEMHPSNMPEIVENKSNNEEIVIENCSFITPESESGNVEIIHNNIEPIHYCEVMLQSNSNELRDFWNEFDNSFFSRRDSLTHSDHNFVQRENLNMNNTRQTTKNSKSKNDEETSYPLNRLNILKNCKDSLERKVGKGKQNIVTNKSLDQQLQPLQINSHKIDSDNINNFQIKSRHRFIPKGMSPIAENQVKLQNVYPFVGDEVYYKDMIYKNFANDVVLNTEIFEPEVKNVKNLFLKHIEKVNGDIQKQNADLIFDSLSLTRAKILGQVDCKFVASILNGRSAQTGKYSEFLVLFDQHAVDERIKLENNLLDYIQDNSWKGIDIDPVSMVLSKDDYLYFINHKDKLAQFGLQWTLTSDYEILFNAIPKAILGKNNRQAKIVIKAVKKLISEQIIAIKSLGGNVSLYPKSIMELVFSEACRYAIKFGDKLSKSECSNMINSLARCKTPFQCAHGRPVMAVLMQLNNNNRTYKVNLTKVKKFKRCLKPKIQ